MRLTEFCVYPGKRTRRLPTDECQEKYSQEALEHGFTSKIDLFCTLCQGTRTFSVYYKCYECSNFYSGIGSEK
ncbi:hypothetical protein MFLAVUS_009975 [Mucor flavus]|uniref:Uncharacterized protein n=1 Tax=Mucor flavus TaxID=439312 RepID=A0ABP9ZBD2_9FUNG